MRRSADDDQVSTFECLLIGAGDREDSNPWSEALSNRFGDRACVSEHRFVDDHYAALGTSYRPPTPFIVPAVGMRRPGSKVPGRGSTE